MDGLGGFADFSIVENSAKLLDALNRLDGQRLRKVFSKRDERGYTLLHVATERNQTESLKCLVIKNSKRVIFLLVTRTMYVFCVQMPSIPKWT